MANEGTILEDIQEAVETAVVGLTLNHKIEGSNAFTARPIEERVGGAELEELTFKPRMFEWRLPMEGQLVELIAGSSSRQKRFTSEIIISYPTSALWQFVARDDVDIISEHFLTSHNSISSGVAGLQLMLTDVEQDARYEPFPEDPQWMIVTIPFLTIIEVS